MAKPDNDAATAQPEQPTEIPVERTNAYRAGFMSGYTKDNERADPSVAGYMDGYMTQDKGAKPDPAE
jgi:hypothetical protein